MRVNEDVDGRGEELPGGIANHESNCTTIGAGVPAARKTPQVGAISDPGMLALSAMVGMSTFGALSAAVIASQGKLRSKRVISSDAAICMARCTAKGLRRPPDDPTCRSNSLKPE